MKRPAPPAREFALALGALLTSSATLVCCVLPAVFVALGAGAALAGLVTALPQLVWLSEHKAGVFGVAGAMLVISGVSLWIGRRASCPSDPRLARACRRLRQGGAWLYSIALLSYLLGVLFAFLLPRLAP